MAVRKILLLGDERLYRISQEVPAQGADTVSIVRNLRDTLQDFRKKYGFGRAIAAPQINEPYRILYMELDGHALEFINPRLEFPEEKQFELWDDCMSFPGVEVHLRRYEKCTVRYQDQKGVDHCLDAEGDLSELLQHEYDHLDGILAVQRAIDKKSLRINEGKARCF